MIAQERRATAVGPNHFRGDRVKIPGRYTGRRRFSDGLVHRSDALSCDLHLGEVFRLLLRDDLRSSHQDASSLTTLQKISSTDPTPSTRRTRSP